MMTSLERYAKGLAHHAARAFADDVPDTNMMVYGRRFVEERNVDLVNHYDEAREFWEPFWDEYMKLVEEYKAFRVKLGLEVY